MKKITVGLFLFIFLFGINRSALAAKDANRENAMQMVLNMLEKEARAQEPASQAESSEPKVQEESLEDSALAKGTAPDIEKGAWTLRKGQVYLESYNKYYWHNSSFTKRNKRNKWPREGRYHEIMSQLKFEYGITDRLTSLLHVPYKWAYWSEEKDIHHYRNKGWQDMWLGGKYRVLDKPVVTSFQVRVKLPLDYSTESTPGLGDNQVDTEFKVLLGRSLRPLPAYGKMEFGYRIRQKEPVDQMPYFFEFGYNLTDNLLFKTSIDGVEAVYGGPDAESYTKWVRSFVYRIRKGLSVEVGYGWTFAGKNSSAGKEIILSTVVQF